MEVAVLNEASVHRPTGVNKKTRSKLNLNNLPFNMLRKLPGGLKEAKKRKALKKKKNRRNDKQSVTEEIDSSDNTQSLDEGRDDSNYCSEEDTIQPVPNFHHSEGFDLEVVLPFEGGVSRLSRRDGSGVENLLEGGGFIEEEYKSAKSQESEDDIPMTREVAEAKKLININVELGVKFNGGEEEDVGRMMGLEVRDRTEKIEWERSRGYQ
ncbi:hypothetical protein P8452_30799 [Trifolium repens]|nr:hypothetical protein P8452_30799 [Trifolium repens]